MKSSRRIQTTEQPGYLLQVLFTLAHAISCPGPRCCRFKGIPEDEIRKDLWKKKASMLSRFVSFLKLQRILQCHAVHPAGPMRVFLHRVGAVEVQGLRSTPGR